MARGWKFSIQKAEKLYYLRSQNKGADQLHSYCKADSVPLFSHMQNVGFLMRRLILHIECTVMALTP